MPERCIMYVDGYNFYYAIERNAALTPIYLGWCDFAALGRQFMVPNGGVLEKIKYFTAPVGRYGKKGGHLGSEEGRQARWLQAIASIDNLVVVEGVYTGDSNAPRGREEKETDVQIAISMVIDASGDHCDRAIVLTGDRDQRPAVRAVAVDFGKKVDVWISPNQEIGFWKAAEAYGGVRVRPITRSMLEKSRLPEVIKMGDTIVEAPRIWRRPG
jgi:hypothetical protein